MIVDSKIKETNEASARKRRKAVVNLKLGSLWSEADKEFVTRLFESYAEVSHKVPFINIMVLRMLAYYFYVEGGEQPVTTISTVAGDPTKDLKYVAPYSKFTRLVEEYQRQEGKRFGPQVFDQHAYLNKRCAETYEDNGVNLCLGVVSTMTERQAKTQSSIIGANGKKVTMSRIEREVLDTFIIVKLDKGKLSLWNSYKNVI